MNNTNSPTASLTDLVVADYKPSETRLKILIFLIFILFAVSIYLGYNSELDKKHMLSLGLSFLTLIIVTAINFKQDMQFIEINKKLDSMLSKQSMSQLLK